MVTPDGGASGSKNPENMDLLYQGETQIRRQPVAAIEADPLLLDHVVLIEATMNHIDFFVRPFFDIGLLKAVLGEMALLAAQVGNYFSGFFDKPEKTKEDIVGFEVWLHRYVIAGEWAEKYLGRKHDRTFVAQMEKWLLDLKAKRA